jgi:hypothetical protein
MSIVVYWLEKSDVLGLLPKHVEFCENELAKALSKAAELRDDLALSHVTVCSEMSNCTSKPGVSSVENGKTPDGLDYEWSKAGRAGKPRRSDANKVVFKG